MSFNRQFGPTSNVSAYKPVLVSSNHDNGVVRGRRPLDSCNLERQLTAKPTTLQTRDVRQSSGLMDDISAVLGGARPEHIAHPRNAETQ
jgi:hypothetical protein